MRLNRSRVPKFKKNDPQNTTLENMILQGFVVSAYYLHAFIIHTIQVLQ